MESVAVVAVLLSAFLHAAWNALLKREHDSEGATLALQVVTAGIGLCVGLVDPRRDLGGASALAWGLTAGALEAVYFVTLSRALRGSGLGAAYTVARGGSLVVLWPLSVLFLGEPITVPAMAGVLLVLAGLALVAGTSVTRGAGLWWAALCAVTIAGYGLAYKQALAHGAATLSLYALSGGVSASIGLLRAGRRGREGLGASLARRLGPYALTSVVCWLSFWLVLVALERAGAGAVMTLRNTSVLFAVLFAALLGEGPRRGQVLGAVLVAVGAVLVSARW